MIKIPRHIFCRPLSVKSAADKSIYQKLRSDTGFPFIKIKEALLENENDPVKAHLWLKDKAASENWEKAQKLSQRETAQGIVGVLSIPGFVSMSALQCETESVSKNQYLKELLNHCNRALQNLDSNGNVSPDSLLDLSYNGKITSDVLTNTIGHLGENIKVKGCFKFKLTHPEISAHKYVHKKSECDISGLSGGAICSLAVFRNLNDEALGNTIAQHIVGSESTISLHDQPLLQDESITIGQLCKKFNFNIIDYCRMSAQ